MVKLEQDLGKFRELKESRSIDETNELLGQGWKLLEASVKDGKKSFLLGKEIPGIEKRQEFEKEVEKVIEKHEFKEELVKEKKEQVEERKENAGKLKSLIFGPIMLAAGLWLFFELSPKKITLFGIEAGVLENLILLVSVILVVAGLVNVFHAVAQNPKSRNS
jgi:hypothetical protein